MGRPTGVLTCYRTRRRIGAYLDQALDERTARATADHLASCQRCQTEADTLRRLRGLLRRNLAPAPPDWTGFWQGVVRGIEDARAARPVPAPRRWWQQAWRPRWAVGSALAAALLITLGLWQFTPTPSSPARAGVMVTSARTEDPRGTVMVYSTPEQDVAVVWVFGLDQE
jgi:anti-sigma factor RsiW